MKYKGYEIRVYENNNKWAVLQDDKLVSLDWENNQVEHGTGEKAAYGRCKNKRMGILRGKLCIDGLRGNISNNAGFHGAIMNIYRYKFSMKYASIYRERLENFKNKYKGFDLSLYPEVFE